MPLPRAIAVILSALKVCALCVLSPVSIAAPAREVQIGIGLSKPPYIMTPEGTGLEYDIVEKALAVRGYRMVAHSYPPARALALMQAGLLDGMATVTEGIGGNGYFSDDYITYQNVAITLARRGIRLADVHDLSGHSVAAFQNARFILGKEFSDMASRHTNYKEYAHQVTQNRLLFSGRVDVVVGDRLIFRYLNQLVEPPVDPTQAVIEHRIFPPTPRKAVFRDAALRDDFNAGLKTIRQNGAYAAILQKYRSYLER